MLHWRVESAIPIGLDFASFCFGHFTPHGNCNRAGSPLRTVWSAFQSGQCFFWALSRLLAMSCQLCRRLLRPRAKCRRNFRWQTCGIFHPNRWIFFFSNCWSHRLFCHSRRLKPVWCVSPLPVPRCLGSAICCCCLAVHLLDMYCASQSPPVYLALSLRILCCVSAMV